MICGRVKVRTWRPQTYGDPVISYDWRGAFASEEVSALHAEGFGRQRVAADWRGQVERHSLGWVCGREGNQLIGFVNVAWDGARHAFILDTLVTRRLRRQGVGACLVEAATRGAREAGCEWLHVDFEDHLRPFYLDSCGFRPTQAGLVAL